MDRSRLLKTNILQALFIKAGSIACSLVLVPMTINFVNSTQYGIWLTISSVVIWMQFFDIGFSNGLRNKLAEALALGDIKKAKSYISTTYGCLAVIFGVLAIILCALIWLLPICPLFNIDSSYEPDLKVAATVLVLYFCANFVVKILSFIFLAKQRSALSSLLDFIGQLFVLVTVWLLQTGIEGNLRTLSLALCIPPLLVWIAASLISFKGKLKDLAPSMDSFHFSDTRIILGLGVKFFVIGIAFIIQFQTSNFLIARLFSVEQVTSYNIVYKYFNVLYMAFFLAAEPLWSAITDAWTRADRLWIRSAIKKYVMLAGACAVCGLVMIVLSDFVYDFWINSKVDSKIEFPKILSVWMFAYVISTIWGQPFCSFVNGIGALKIQFISSMISPAVFIGAALFFVRVLNFGPESILMASILANFNGLILAPLQYWKVMHQGKAGIWAA